MNCKPGDLAVVVRTLTPGMVGRFVIVERFLVPGERLENGSPVERTDRPARIIRSAVDGDRLPNRRRSGQMEYLLRRALLDDCLRPIRPNEGEDESLSWARPKVEETA